MLIFCLAVNFVILTILAIAAFGSVIRYWPYNFELTFDHYDFTRADPMAWSAYTNSIKMGLWTMVFGTIIVFSAAYLVEKARGFTAGRGITHFLSMMPLAVPGLVLGLSYILFFNKPWNPFNFIYATMAILVISTIIHYSPVPYLIGVTALKQMDKEFEPISASLKVRFYRTFWRVTVPVCLPAILDISIFFFLRAMTTVSAVIFLFGSDTVVASVIIVNMEEVGLIAAAAAMSIMIVVTSIGVRLMHWLLTRAYARRAQAWRHR
jgi:iron(III) transport system permease protein